MKSYNHPSSFRRDDLHDAARLISENSRFSWIANVFMSSNIRSIAAGKLPEQLQTYSKIRQKNLTLECAINEIYMLMLTNYRNEYIYRNEMINKIYNTRHCIDVSSIYSEFRVGDSRADIAVFNGSSTCYEIKTDIDNLDRLENQMLDYSRLFEYVYVLVSENRLKDVSNHLENHVGILVIDEKNSINELKKASSNIETLDNKLLFRALRQSEWLKIALQYEADISNLNVTEMYYRAVDIFSSLSTHDAHIHFMSALRSRPSARQGTHLARLPNSLANAYFTTKMSKGLWDSFLSQIDQPI